MDNTPEVRVVCRVSEDTMKRLKKHLIDKGVTIQDFMLKAINKELEKAEATA